MASAMRCLRKPPSSQNSRHERNNGPSISASVSGAGLQIRLGHIDPCSPDCDKGILVAIDDAELLIEQLCRKNQPRPSYFIEAEGVPKSMLTPRCALAEKSGSAALAVGPLQHRQVFNGIYVTTVGLNMRPFYSVAALSLVGAIVLAGQNAMAQKKKKEAEVTPAAVVTPAVVGPGPDIAIVESETVVEAGGCGVDDPLIKGTIAIKNRGDARAERLLAKPIAAVYLPENLDIKDEDIVPNALQPNELFSTDILAGKGAVKDDRGFKGKRKVFIIVDPYNAIHESNESNNVIVREVTFSCK